MGPEEMLRLAYVANRYYNDNRSRIEIADELGLSRFKVARMLEEAKERGIVSITVETPGPVDAHLSLRLKERFGLRRALVVATPMENSEVVQQYLGRVAAQLLEELVTPGEVVGLTSGRTLTVMARNLGALASADIVQLSGVAGSIQSTAVEVMRRASLVSGGRAYTIYAPLVMSDVDATTVLRRQPEISTTLAQYSRVSLAMVAVGSWQPPDSELFESRALDQRTRTMLLQKGVIADVGGLLVARDGRLIRDLDARTIAANEEQLRAIPEVIGVAGGRNKTDAVMAALRSGLVNSLVTDSGLARRLLDE
ncbi:sugar-binding transcriptional regulator [Microbacterium sp. NPDC058389]|uniref:sugar-binding transcriptional regulator n=1 Tax=Microbacterium sp. NPDC058389 TaxID=3346475 RepID=UPI0036531581